MDLAFTHLWIGSRADQVEPSDPMPAPKEDTMLVSIGKSGIVSVQEINPDDVDAAYLRAMRGAR